MEKRSEKHRSAALAGAILFLSGALIHGQTHEGVELVSVRLIADSATVAPGRPVTLGLHLTMAPGWHTYWKNPGDAGLPTTLDLDLPEGFRATELHWPLPQRLDEPGGLKVYGYKDEVLLMARLFPPAALGGQEVGISGRASWLVCDKICLPGDAEVSLRLTVAESLEPVNEELFAKFRRKIPQPLARRPDSEIKFEWKRVRQNLILEISDPESGVWDFFPLPPPGVVTGNPEKRRRHDGGIQALMIPISSAPPGLSSLPGVLVHEKKDNGRREGWTIRQ